jgi:hypothetical protein
VQSVLSDKANGAYLSDLLKGMAALGCFGSEGDKRKDSAYSFAAGGGLAIQEAWNDYPGQ